MTAAALIALAVAGLVYAAVHSHDRMRSFQADVARDATDLRLAVPTGEHGAGDAGTPAEGAGKHPGRGDPP